MAGDFLLLIQFFFFLAIETACLVMFLFLGKTEIKIRLLKKLGRMKGCIIAKELRKDGRIYTTPVKLEGSKVKLGKRTYEYDINMTSVNEYEMREAYFSEITSKQFDPYRLEHQGSLSSDQISDLLIMSTSIAMIPKPAFSLPMPKLTGGIVIIAIVVMVLLASGFLKP